MIQRAFHVPAHVAIVMDGNGRWAERRGLPRTAGHLAGAHAVRRIVEAAAHRGITVLTLYAFSGDNWKRPPAEVAGLFRLFERWLDKEQRRCVRERIRLEVIGRRDRLPPALLRAIAAAEQATRDATPVDARMTLRIALDYSARDAIVEAAALLRDGRAAAVTRADVADALGRAMHASGAPDVDLLLRTGGEQRLSDFLLWECAYAELVFSNELWPDVTSRSLDAALHAFGARERRFGAVPASRAPTMPEDVARRALAPTTFAAPSTIAEG